MSRLKPKRGERCYLSDFRRLRYTEVSADTYRVLQDSELYVIGEHTHTIKVSFKPDATEGYLIDKRCVMSETEHYKRMRESKMPLDLRKEKRDAWCKNAGVQRNE